MPVPYPIDNFQPSEDERLAWLDLTAKVLRGGSLSAADLQPE